MGNVEIPEIQDRSHPMVTKKMAGAIHAVCTLAANPVLLLLLIGSCITSKVKP